MASANVDLVRSIYAAWERGDFSSVEWAHPNIEYSIRGGPSPGTWVGLAALAEGARELMTAWEDYRVQADEYRRLDDERVLVLDHVNARGKTSGVELGQIRPTAATLFSIRDRKVIRLVTYWDRDTPLADLGLAEGDAPGPPS